MAFKVLVAICVIAVVCISDARKACGPFEVFNECGTPCERICGEPAHLTCPGMCASGCFCEEGTRRTAEGTCMPNEYCDFIGNNQLPHVCGANEEYTTVCGSHYVPNCDPFGPLTCTDDCVQGCYCKEGFFKRDGGLECVKSSSY